MAEAKQAAVNKRHGAYRRKRKGCTMQRIQYQRTYSWRAPTGAVYVGSFTQWANPYESYIFGAERAVVLYCI
jgi:hypothetical protein